MAGITTGTRFGVRDERIVAFGVFFPNRPHLLVVPDQSGLLRRLRGPATLISRFEVSTQDGISRSLCFGHDSLARVVLSGVARMILDRATHTEPNGQGRAGTLAPLGFSMRLAYEKNRTKHGLVYKILPGS